MSRIKRHPDNPFDYMTFHTEKLNSVRDELAEMLQTPEGIEQLKTWNPQQMQGNGEEALSKKMRFVVSAMKKPQPGKKSCSIWPRSK